MYICMCYAVSDKDIYELVVDQGKHILEVIDETSASSCCGACSDYLHQYYKDLTNDKD